MKNWFKTNTDSSPKDKKWWKPNISWLKLDKWVKRLDIYIIKKFLGTYFFAIALIISIAVGDHQPGLAKLFPIPNFEAHLQLCWHGVGVRHSLVSS